MSYSGWAVIELMGHRQRGGRVCEVEMYGGRMLRIDIPQPDGCDDITEFYGVQSIYAMTPCSEEIVRERFGGRDMRPVKPAQNRLDHDDGDE